MRQDIELAVARRREQLRVEVEKQLESKYSEKLAERKSRLRRNTILPSLRLSMTSLGLSKQILKMS